MITLTEVQLNAWLTGLLWPLARILALIATVPVLGNEVIPARFKIALGLLITIIIAPLAGPPQAVELWSGSGMAILVQQIAIGTAMGFTMRIVFAMVDLAGELTGLQMGLGFASFFDPQNAADTALISQYLGIMMTLIFLGTNSHLLVIATLTESFQVLPISADPLGSALWLTLVQWGGKTFSIGLMLALPILAALLIANLALGILTRAAPQLNIFSIGFPITLLLGFAVLLLVLPQMSAALEKPLQQGLEMMLALARNAH
ncbi:flagellar export pore protein [Georgfuchsia toluolica]|uniref:Flagellar biosynthetic protein FliR n=1 Tax=Georgfuchsia toluolica TaxID=424218 RepID=A0A916N7I5_9PROT|nr:flagellar biosynthetic protein FliR [Georgfuchsia toluolica]CAG4882188.1 flagellar export pore protein [Georgfuchsia toluolica]